MDNVKDDKYYINKILIELEFILKYTKNLSFEDFNSN